MDDIMRNENQYSEGMLKQLLITMKHYIPVDQFNNLHSQSVLIIRRKILKWLNALGEGMLLLIPLDVLSYYLVNFTNFKTLGEFYQFLQKPEKM